MPDYAALSAVALRLVQNAGRTITLVDLNTTAADPLKPWRGPADPRTTPTATLSVSAVFVEPSSAARLGLVSEEADWLKRSTQVAIIASTADLSPYNEILDEDGQRWRVTGFTKLKPGSTTLLYYIGAER